MLKRRSKKIFVFIAASLGILILLTLSNPMIIMAFADWGKNIFSTPHTYEKQAIAYLKEKYHEDFVITKVEYRSVFDRYDMKAYPVSKSNYLFNVVVIYHHEKKEYVYQDDYELKKTFQSVAESMFPRDEYFCEAVYDSPLLTDGAYGKPTMKIIEENPGRVQVDININTLLSEDSTRLNSENEKLQMLADSIRGHKYGKIRILLIYYNPKKITIEQFIKDNQMYGAHDFSFKHNDHRISGKIRELNK